MIKIDLGLIISLVIFFLIFFILFTVIPRFMFFHLERLLNRRKGFWNNYLNLIKTYIFLGLPLGSILYYGATFGDTNKIESVFADKTLTVVIITAIITLITIRLSILLKKRWILQKFKLLKVFDKWIPLLGSRSKLKDIFINKFNLLKLR